MWRVKSLYDLSAATLGDSLVNVTEKLLKERSTSFIEIAEQLERLYLQVRDLPPCHHAKLVYICLKAACEVSRVKCSSKRKFAVKKLMQMLTRLKPRKVELLRRDENLIKLKFAHFALIDSFKEMKVLEKIEFNFLRDYRFERQKFIKNCSALGNLVSFSSRNATDEVARAVCESCPLIQEIDLCRSKKVTDNCITSLTKCEKLRIVELGFTSVSTEGFAQLLLNTRSDCLQEVREVGDMDQLMHRLENDAEPGRIFQLKKLIGQVTDLKLIPFFFPKIIELNITSYNPKLTRDISALDQLKNVKEVAIHFYLKSADVFTNFNCHALTDLTLDYCTDTDSLLQIKITTIMKVGLQCPNIELLGLISISFLDDTGSIEFCELSGRPFQKLRDLCCIECSYVSCLKVILSHTFSIEKIFVLNEDSSLTDEFFECILRSNPLERLEYLMVGSENISANILKRIITDCKKISKLGDFSKFVGMSENQVQEIINLIIKKGLIVQMVFDCNRAH